MTGAHARSSCHPSCPTCSSMRPKAWPMQSRGPVEKAYGSLGRPGIEAAAAEGTPPLCSTWPPGRYSSQREAPLVSHLRVWHHHQSGLEARTPCCRAPRLWWPDEPCAAGYCVHAFHISNTLAYTGCKGAELIRAPSGSIVRPCIKSDHLEGYSLFLLTITHLSGLNSSASSP